MRKLFLGQAFGLSKQPKIPSKRFTYIHKLSQAACRVFNYGVYSTNGWTPRSRLYPASQCTNRFYGAESRSWQIRP